jgi:ARG and Rhodanese-Phosphatase-superfamily-associated Protein domain
MNVNNLSFQKYKSLSIVQFRTEGINSFEYISLANALRNKFIEVKEVSDSGSVNNLSVVNHSGHFIFMSDGDILSGAKQNRVLNTSVLVSPNSILTIPVSCVEQGRWRYSSSKFSDSLFSAPSYMRSEKARDVKENLKNKKSFMADQSRVWSNVNEYEQVLGCKSSTSNLSDIYENKKNDIDEFIKSFKSAKDTNGIAIFVHNRLLNLEIFNKEEIYDEYFTKLLKSSAFETINLKEKENNLTESEAFYKTNTFFDNMSDIKYEIHKGVGAGIEKRFETNDMTGFELEFDNNLIHYVALNLVSSDSRF